MENRNKPYDPWGNVGPCLYGSGMMFDEDEKMIFMIDMDLKGLNEAVRGLERAQEDALADELGAREQGEDVCI